MEVMTSLGAGFSAETAINAAISLFVVLFGGTMSGLTLGLMSLDLVKMEVLQRSGTPMEQMQAEAIYLVGKKQHELLVTLLLCNAVAMEALPIFLDEIFDLVVAIILSVSFVLLFGEIIPQAICSRYGLTVGANLIWLVKILMIICSPVSFPFGKFLDFVLGHNDAGLFRRAQLKALVSIHGEEEGKRGELTHDETTIISGALDLTLKTAEEAMALIESTFSLDADSKLHWEALGRILATGHNLYMAAVVRQNPIIKLSGTNSSPSQADENATTGMHGKGSKEVEAIVIDIDMCKEESEVNVDLEQNGEVIGIITLEDVIEELLQEEIIDETDEYVDVHKRIRVAAAANFISSSAFEPFKKCNTCSESEVCEGIIE
ncbi:hypothetical protein KP509_17G008700 [Ceratopteris richardii]|uniref:CNNM transmembrane domain-containing protein n=1 Tax=Ceratopteris richardii TaxID=49495 RepID=A0A8T2SSP6_CERRI|nr:hypothetical protein KP509_17G008700 [Ceratopteris richardii]